MTCFCTLGTSSGGISTPRSPRATISASARSMISSRRRIAAGFSSLTMQPGGIADQLAPLGDVVRPLHKGQRDPIGALLAARRTRSARSLSVIAEIGNTAFGTLTPLWSDSVPPTRHSVSAKSAPQSMTRSRTLPSSSSSSVPGCSASKISGCGSGARLVSPGVVSRSRRKWHAGGELRLAAGEIAEPQLRPLQIGEDADRPSGLGFDRADLLEPRAVLVVRAVAEIEAEHIDPGVEQRAQPLARSSSPGRASRRSWRCASGAAACCGRAGARPCC